MLDKSVFSFGSFISRCLKGHNYDRESCTIGDFRSEGIDLELDRAEFDCNCVNLNFVLSFKRVEMWQELASFELFYLEIGSARFTVPNLLPTNAHPTKRPMARHVSSVKEPSAQTGRR